MQYAVQLCERVSDALVEKPNRQRYRNRYKKVSNAPIADGVFTIWTPQIVAQHQKEDKVLGLIVQWVESGEAKPTWENVSRETLF